MNIKMLSLRATVFYILNAIVSSSGHAQAVSLDELRSGDDTVRIGAFYRLLGSEAGPASADIRTRTRDLLAQRGSDRDRLAETLIELLESEQRRIRNAPNVAARGANADYIGDLVGVVSSLRDPRAVPALVNAISTGSMASDGLADLGDDAVPALVEALSSENDFTRFGAAHTLDKVAGRASELGLSGRSMDALREALVRGLSDNSFMVRAASADGLAHFSGDEIEALMRELENSDPYRSPAGRWSVREAARRWLARHGG